MPGRSTVQLGVPVLIVGALAWLLPMITQILGLRIGHHQPLLFEATRFAWRQVATVPLVVAGALLIVHAPGGLDWLTAGLILCIVVSLATAWVLLVEILRWADVRHRWRISTSKLTMIVRHLIHSGAIDTQYLRKSLNSCISNVACNMLCEVVSLRPRSP